MDITKVEKKIDRHNIPSEVKLIDFSVVLISLLGNNHKTTYFKYDETPIALGKDIIALKMTGKVDIEYFITQMYSQLVKIQLEMIYTGSIINRIKKDDFLKIKVILPNLELEEEYKQVIKNTEYDVIATISHNLNQKLGSVVDNYEALIRVLQRLEKEKEPMNFLYQIRKARPNEKTENIDTIANIAQRLKINLDDAIKTLKTTEDILQKNEILSEKKDFVKFLREEVKPQYNQSNFSITIIAKPKKVEVAFDSNAIKDVLRNLIENAKKHGFVDSNLDYSIILEVSKYISENGKNTYLRLVCKNNGKPFPKKFSFEEFIRLGGRAGNNRGSGLGGFFINKVVSLHNGIFRMISGIEDSEPFQVQFEILLPLF